MSSNLTEKSRFFCSLLEVQIWLHICGFLKPIYFCLLEKSQGLGIPRVFHAYLDALRGFKVGQTRFSCRLSNETEQVKQSVNLVKQYKNLYINANNYSVQYLKKLYSDDVACSLVSLCSILWLLFHFIWFPLPLPLPLHSSDFQTKKNFKSPAPSDHLWSTHKTCLTVWKTLVGSPIICECCKPAGKINLTGTASSWNCAASILKKGLW